jgi:hypothetical protein
LKESTKIKNKYKNVYKSPLVTVTKAFSHTKETAYLVVICKSGRFSFVSVFEELHLMSREFIIVCTFNPLLFAVS